MSDHTPAYLTTHIIAGDQLVYGLAHEDRELAAKVDGAGRQGKLLAKQPGLSVVLVAMGRGNRLGEHATPGATTIQVLRGKVTLHAAGEATTLGQGEFASLGPGVSHDAEALEPSALLVTVVHGDA